MHSTARMNGDDGSTMVDMTKMNRILHFTDDTVTVEAGATYIVVSNALKDRGLQFHVTTEIGNVTLGAMATAATKDSSFPGGFGQVSSYVTAVRLVTPQGQLREINERDNPEEMQIIRSSYGLLGIVYEVTIKVRPTTALSVRHYSLSLDNFRRYYPIYKARGFAVMYYIFPYVKRVLVELARTILRPSRRRAGAGPTATALAQIWAGRHAVDRAHDEQSPIASARRQAALLPAAPGARVHRAQRQHLASRSDHQLPSQSWA
jgi:FAD/FMN-containing dehydrogenase